MKKPFFSLLILGLFNSALYAMPAPPNTLIKYNLVKLGEQQYRYDYTITNLTSTNTTPIQLFDITFDTLLYDENSLVITTPAPLSDQWSEVLLFSITGESLIYDVFSVAGVLDGQSAGVFSVEFQWQGTGIPTPQSFEIYDPDTFVVIESGTTQLQQFIDNTAPNVPVANPLQAVPTLSLFNYWILAFSLLLMGFNMPKPHQLFNSRFK